MFLYCYKPILLPKLVNMYMHMKFPIQVYHRPMPCYTVAYCVAYSMEWIDSLRLSSKLYALPTPSHYNDHDHLNYVLSGKQRTISPISRRPNFTTFEQNTLVVVAIKTFKTEF